MNRVCHPLILGGAFFLNDDHFRPHRILCQLLILICLLFRYNLERCKICDEKAELEICHHCERKACKECRTAHMEMVKRDLGRLLNQVSSYFASNLMTLRNNKIEDSER